VAYRDDALAREARIAAVRSELASLEAELEHQRGARAVIEAADRDRGWLRVLTRPGMLLVLVLAIAGGVYAGSAFHVVDVYSGGGSCTEPSGSAEHP
jgi:anti-sigma factor RsiW